MWLLIALSLIHTPAAASRQMARAGQPCACIEVWGGLSGVLSAPSGVLVSSYSPPLLFASGYTSTGGQTLTLEGQRGVGFMAGLNILSRRGVGLQLFLDRAEVDLSGHNGPYALTLTYVSQPPPSGIPQTVTVEQSVPWADSTGVLTELTLGANAVVRAGRPEHVNVTASGGLSIYRLSGRAEPLAYTTFRLGGHSVLFSDEYHVAVGLGATTATGYNIGGDVNLPMGAHASLLVGFRYLGGPEVELPVKVLSVVNAGQVINEESPASIAQGLGLEPARFTISASRLMIGIKVR